jgi:hypothetical protein
LARWLEVKRSGSMLATLWCHLPLEERPGWNLTVRPPFVESNFLGSMEFVLLTRMSCVVLFMINIVFLFILLQKMELKPSEIYFSQAEINNVFNKRSCHPYKNLGETLDELVEDLQLPMQSVSITTNVVSSNLATGEEYSLQHNMICFLRVLRFSPQVKLTATHTPYRYRGQRWIYV